MQAEKDWLLQLQKQNVLAIASLAVESLSLRVSIHCREREGGRGQGREGGGGDGREGGGKGEKRRGGWRERGREGVV